MNNSNNSNNWNSWNNYNSYGIYSLQCSTQQNQIFNYVQAKKIDSSKLQNPPSTTPPNTKQWYKMGILNNPEEGVVYLDSTDPTYNYLIQIYYNGYYSNNPCFSNPLASCSCIVTIQQDKAGNQVGDTVPDTVVTDALNHLPIASGCSGVQLPIIGCLQGIPLALTILGTVTVFMFLTSRS